MGNINVKYKDSNIIESSNNGPYYLLTKDKYCEDDIKIEYTPKHKTYYLEFSNEKVNNGDVVLVTLDEELLSHINDEAFTAHLVNIDFATKTDSSIIYEMLGTNRPLCYSSSTAIYGVVSSGPQTQSLLSRPINATTITNGNYGNFRINGNNFCYCYYGSDASWKVGLNGKYTLTFAW